MSTADAKIPEMAQLRLAEKVEASGGAAAFAAALTAPETASETATSNPDQGGNVTDQAKNETDQPAEKAADPAVDVSMTDRAPPTDETENASGAEDAEQAPPEDRIRPVLGPLPVLAAGDIADDYGDDEEDPDDSPAVEQATAALRQKAADIPILSQTAEIRVSDDDDVLDGLLDTPDSDAISRQVTIVPTGDPAPTAIQTAKTCEREVRAISERQSANADAAPPVATAEPIVLPPPSVPVILTTESPVEKICDEMRRTEEEAVQLEIELRSKEREPVPVATVNEEEPVRENIPSRMAPDFASMRSTEFDAAAARRKLSDGSYHVPSELLWTFLARLAVEISEAGAESRENLLRVRQVCVNEFFARGEGRHRINDGQFTRDDLKRFIGECVKLIMAEKDEGRRSALEAALEPAAKWYGGLLELEKKAQLAKPYTSAGRLTQSGNTPPGEPAAVPPHYCREEPLPQIPDPFAPPPAAPAPGEGEDQEKAAEETPPKPGGKEPVKPTEGRESFREAGNRKRVAFLATVMLLTAGLLVGWLLFVRSYGLEIFIPQGTETPPAAATAQE